MKLRLSPLPDADNGSYGFGAQVHGVDVAAVAQQASGGEDGGIRATMLQAMREHGLLLFRGQKELEPEEQLAFAKIFPWDMTASPDLDSRCRVGMDRRSFRLFQRSSCRDTVLCQLATMACQPAS
jgi:hypothetical protein